MLTKNRHCTRQKAEGPQDFYRAKGGRKGTVRLPFSLYKFVDLFFEGFFESTTGGLRLGGLCIVKPV